MFLAMDTEADTLRTSWTLVARLKNLDDTQSWEAFVALYRPLILRVAIRAGLRQDEAEDVVQETMTVMTKHIQDFVAEPSRGSFRSWLLTIARRRICDQFGKRLPVAGRSEARTSGTARTPTVERVPSPAEADLAAMCDEEWSRHLREEALQQLQLEVKPAHYQVFHLLTLEEKPIEAVAKMVGRSRAQIYLIKHRVGNKLKKIVRRLEKELG
jgi:RNA polymerase sigma-70 factor (ECF subfamily)